VTAVPPPAQGVLTAMAGMTALRQGLHLEVLEMGAESPFAFAGAVALASEFADALRAAGGDPDALMDQWRRRAYEPAPS
jgi:hypothetical protein